MRPRTLVALVVAALAAAVVSAGVAQDPRATLFVRGGCQECHAIAALGVKAAADVGPDLTFAYADVVDRYGMSLPSFLDEAPGLMGFVFASHLHLTQADRDSMARILHALYEERMADMDQDVPSFPPGRARPHAREKAVLRPPTRE